MNTSARMLAPPETPLYGAASNDLRAVAGLLVEAAHSARDGDHEAVKARIAHVLDLFQQDDNLRLAADFQLPPANQDMRTTPKMRPRFGPDSREHLSARERTVLALIAQGQSNKLIARALNVAPETIKSHLKRVFVKLGARTRAEAVARAVATRAVDMLADDASAAAPSRLVRHASLRAHDVSRLCE